MLAGLVAAVSPAARAQSTAEWSRMKADCRARGGTICENYNDCRGQCVMPEPSGGGAPPAGGAGAPSAASAVGDALGSVIGGSMIDRLPPVDPNKYGNKAREQLNQKEDDGRDPEVSRGVSAAQDLLNDYQESAAEKCPSGEICLRGDATPSFDAGIRRDLPRRV